MKYRSNLRFPPIIEWNSVDSEFPFWMENNIDNISNERNALNRLRAIITYFKKKVMDIFSWFIWLISQLLGVLF